MLIIVVSRYNQVIKLLISRTDTEVKHLYPFIFSLCICIQIHTCMRVYMYIYFYIAKICYLINGVVLLHPNQILLNRKYLYTNKNHEFVK